MIVFQSKHLVRLAAVDDRLLHCEPAHGYQLSHSDQPRLANLTAFERDTFGFCRLCSAQNMCESFLAGGPPLEQAVLLMKTHPLLVFSCSALQLAGFENRDANSRPYVTKPLP